MSFYSYEEIDMTSPERPTRPAPLAPPESPAPQMQESSLIARRTADEPPAASPSSAVNAGGERNTTLAPPPVISIEVLEIIAAQQADAYGQKLREVAEHELRLQKWADALSTKQATLEKWERRLEEQEQLFAEGQHHALAPRVRNSSSLGGLAGDGATSFAERMGVFRRESHRQLNGGYHSGNIEDM